MQAMSRLARIVFIAVPLALLGACASVDGDWERARKADQVSSYQAFLAKYPKSDFTAPARARIDELGWERARRDDRIEALEKFVTDNPASPFREQAAQRIAVLHQAAYDAVRQLATEDAYNEYIKKYPKGPHTLAATGALDELMWAQARQADTLRAFKAYRSRHPAGQHRVEAAQAITVHTTAALTADSWATGEAPDTCRWHCEAKACVDDLDKVLWAKVSEAANKVRGQRASLAYATVQDATHICNSASSSGGGSSGGAPFAWAVCTERASGRMARFQANAGAAEVISTNRLEPAAAAARWRRDCE